VKNNHTPKIRFPGFTGDWEERKLGELIEISSAARVHKNEWTTSGVRFFRSSDVVSNFNGKKNIPAFISFSLYDELSKKSGLVQPGDILVTGGGSIGIPYLIANQEPLYFKDADLIWLKSANKIDGYFLYSYLVTPQLRKYISSITHIGTISHYTIEQAKDTPIILPEQVEQTQIGIFFKQLDDTITLQQQELDMLKQTKQGFLQKMFPKEGKAVPEVRFQEFTGDWEQLKADEIFRSVSDKNHSNLPVLSASQEKGMVYRDEIGIDIKYDEKSTKNYKRVLPGQFVIHLRSFQGGFAFSSITGITSPAYTVLDFKNKEKHHSLFWKYILASDTFIKRLETVTYGIRDGRSISFSDFSTLQFRVPSYNEQIKIGNFFKHLDDAIALHQCELDALKEGKTAFLQKMFA
jgi:type I restriction enzyme, S subunit